MNSSNNLTSQSALQGPGPSPCSGQQLVNWMNGLFDTCGPEDTLWSEDIKVASDITHIATIDPADLDLLAALPSEGDCPDITEQSPTSIDGDFFEGSFMEIFTDLNDIIKMAEPEVAVEPVIELDPTIQENTISTSTSKRGRKRKSTAAAAPSSETTPTGDDHHYSSKKSKSDHTTVFPGTSTEEDAKVDEGEPCEDEPTSPKDRRRQKYAERRRKNNIASRKSRQARKTKNSALEQQAEDLEEENEALRVKIAEAEALTKELKELLVTQLAGVKK